MKKLINVLIVTVLFSGCVAEKETGSNNRVTAVEGAGAYLAENGFQTEMNIQETVERPAQGDTENASIIEPNIELGYYRDGYAFIQRPQLNRAGLANPASLKEISDRLSEDDRNQVRMIRIDNGENITSLEGAELFPVLESLYIYDSNIKTLNDMKEGHYRISTLYIGSMVLEDISDIVLFENLSTLGLLNAVLLRDFPDISHLEMLSGLSLSGAENMNFNALADKLPAGIGNITLSFCKIESLNDVAELFFKSTRLYLSGNLINEIDFDMDYGNLLFIYLAGNPVAEKFPESSVRNESGVRFDVGPFEDNW